MAVSDRAIVRIGALLAGLAVILGAFGAHALKGRIGVAEAGWWETGVQYQLAQGLAVLLVAALPLRRRAAIAAAFAFGALIFSGTLYAMALGAPHWLGAVTPLGGLAMIAGWALILLDPTVPRPAR